MPSGGRGTKYGDLCKDCKSPIDDYNAMFKQHYLQPRCRECHNKHSNSVPSRTKEARKAQYVSWKFGVSIETYNKKYELQLKGCAICKKPCNTGRELAIDHDHITGKIRDLLCLKCNTLVGLIEEDENRLIEAIEYIKRHKLEKAS